MPKAITHQARLAGASELSAAFLDQMAALGAKLGPLLIQLPPSLAFDAGVAAPFFEELRVRTEGSVACEPRHASWFEKPADNLLQNLRIARVAADPARVPCAGLPGGWPGLVYYRLHGSPRMYYSEYGTAYVAELAEKLGAIGAAETWCIFDNTTLGAAAADALSLKEKVIVAAEPD
jgi:uncharacterized protein YecE (DUF72 family)